MRHATSLQAYPNPTNDILHIVSDDAGATLRVCHNDNDTTIDISHLANGLYFLKIENKMVKIINK